MMWRLKDVPKYSQAPSRVEARHYNTIRRALHHLPAPIVLQLRGLSHINMIIDADSWACVDSSLNDLPIVAWTDFQADSRDNLHEPIPCQLSYYHYQAGTLVPRVLDITSELLDERLAAPRCDSAGSNVRRRYRTAGRELYVVS
jgi:hypothetical protein